MAIKVVDLLADVQKILTDDGTRWTLTELQSWLNAGYRDLVVLRPDANTQVGTFDCAVGARQNIAVQFASAARLIDVVRNMAASSNKSAVVLMDRRSLSERRRNWLADTATVSIEGFLYDPRLPTQFMTYPPAASGAQLEVMYSAMPAPHTLTLSQLQNTSTAETIRVDDAYANALMDYVLYRAFGKDTENQAMLARAAAHYDVFKGSISDKTGADMATRPGAA